MTRLQIALFCFASLLASAGAAALLFPVTTLSEHAVVSARTPQPMELLPDVDLGPDFGTLPVVELVGYYLDNPPSPEEAGARTERRRHFGGC